MGSKLKHKDYYGDVTVKHVSDKLKGMKIIVHDGYDESFPLTHHETNMINSIVNNHEAMKNMLDELVEYITTHEKEFNVVIIPAGTLRAAKELQDETI